MIVLTAFGLCIFGVGLWMLIGGYFLQKKLDK